MGFRLYLKRRIPVNKIHENNSRFCRLSYERQIVVPQVSVVAVVDFTLIFVRANALSGVY